MGGMKIKTRFRLIIAGGGTGGHLFPGIAVARELKTRFESTEVLFVIGRKRLESEILSPMEPEFKAISIDVEGIKAKKQIPVLMNHNSSQIVGHSTKTYKDGSFFVSGQFSDVTDKAKEAKGLAQEGFPWQASIGVRPIKILSLEKDGKMDVNGKTLKGPAEVWLESEVFETSFVPLGADGNTSVSTFSKFTEQEAPQGANNNPHEEVKFMDFTLENLAKEAPDLLASIQSDAKTAGHTEGLAVGVTQERERVSGLMKIEDADEAARAKAIAEGLTVEAAYKLFFEAEKGKKAEELKALEESTPESAGQDGKEKGSEDGKTFMSAVDDYQKEHSCTRTAALQAVAKAQPELHQASVKGGK